MWSKRSLRMRFIVPVEIFMVRRLLIKVAAALTRYMSARIARMYSRPPKSGFSSPISGRM